MNIAMRLLLALLVTTTGGNAVAEEMQSERSLVRRTTLVVADAQESIAFYQDILGYTRWFYSEGTVTEGSLPANADVGDPNIFAIMKGKHPWIGMVGLLQKGPARKRPTDIESFRIAPGDTILMMETDDLDAIYQRMLRAGTPIWKHPETTRVSGAGGKQWDATFLFAFDPDGHLLEINQPHFEDEPGVGIRRDFADTRAGQLHYRASPARKGRPLVLLHQTPLSGRMYQTLLPLLAEQRQVYAPDTPGYGESDGFDQPPAISDYSDALIDWLDAVGETEVDLFGYHTGAAIAVDLAARYPNRVRSVILMSVPLFSKEQTQNWDLNEPELFADGSHLLAMWNSTYDNRAPQQTLPMVAATVAEKQRAGQNEWLALRALKDYPLADSLQALTMPVAVFSTADGLQENSSKAADIVNAASVIHRSDWRYGIFDTEADEIASMINDFLRSQDEAAKANKD